MISRLRYAFMLIAAMFMILFPSVIPLCAESIKYEYDDLNRLIRVEHSDGKTIDYSYDEVGNVMQKKQFGDVAAPVTTASPAGGIYNTTQSVTLTCSDGSGVGCDKIYFTTDGTTPTTSSSAYSSPITIASTTTLKFFAKDGVGNMEAVKTETYTIDAAAPVGTVVINSGDEFTRDINVILSVTCNDDRGCSQMQFSNDNEIYSAPEDYATAKTWILASEDGLKTVYVKVKDNTGNWSSPSSDGITLDTTGPLTTASPTGGAYNAAHTVTLICSDGSGAGCDKIYYTTDGSTPTKESTVYASPISVSTTSLKFFSQDKVGNTETVKTETYTIDTAAPVTMASPAGGAYNKPQSVTLSCTDGTGPGCDKIYFTTDGSTPTTVSPVYATPISIASTTTLKFFAKDKAGNNEVVKTETYTIDTAAPVTTASPAGGVYNTTQSVSLSCTDATGSGCDKIYYTKDGKTPTTASPVYSTPISIASTTTLKFFAKDKAGNSEVVKTETYTIDTAAPVTTASPAGGANRSQQKVTLSCTDGTGLGCDKIYYTTDGTTPTAGSAVYDSPIDIIVSKTVKYFAKDKAGNSEAVKVQTYQIDAVRPVTTASPTGGPFKSMRSVTLTCTDGSSGTGCNKIYYTMDGTTPTTSSKVYSAPIIITDSTVLKFIATDKVGNTGVPKTETYTYDIIAPVTTATPAGSTSYNAPQTVSLSCEDNVRNGCNKIYYSKDGTTPKKEYSSPISITSTTTLKYFSKDKADNREQIQSLVYNIDKTLPMTTASPAGGIYASDQTVTLSCVEPSGGDCVIYYSIDGSNPTVHSKLYKKPISITKTTTLKFFGKTWRMYPKEQAIKQDRLEEVKTQSYIVDKNAPITTASSAGGTFNSTQKVTLSCSDVIGTGCDGIYYTLNGATPVPGADGTSVYLSSPITIIMTATLKFFSKDKAGNSEAVKSLNFIIDKVAPMTTASPTGGVYIKPQSVTLSCTEGTSTKPGSDKTGCDKIYYTTDGTTPTMASSVYATPIGITSTTALKFFAKDKAGNSEAMKTETYTIDTAAPVTTASPAGGAYHTTQSVTLSCTDGTGTGCEKIYYTTDGTAPTAASPVYAIPIGIASTTTLKFFATDKAGSSESVKTEVYTIDTAAPVTTASPAGGTYNTAQSVTLNCTDGTGPECDKIYYTMDGTTPTTASPVYASPISIASTSTLKFFGKDKAGNSESVKTEVYTIDTAAPVTTASPAGGTYNTTQSVTLSCMDGTGPGCDKIYYTTDGTAPNTESPVYATPISIAETTTLKFFATDKTGNSEVAKTEVYTIDTAAPVTMASPAGGTYNTAQSVTLSCTDGTGPGCDKIYFTTDGSTPTTASTVYSTPISIASTTTLKFFAQDKAGNSEAVKTEVYTIDTAAPVTTASPAGGTYYMTQSVTLSCTDGTGAGCDKIYYTTDGTTPTAASPVYVSPISIASTTMLKFFGSDKAGNTEMEKTETYTILAAAPATTASPAGGIFNTAQLVTLTCADGTGSECGKIYYSLDGTIPTTSSFIYSMPLSISSTTTLKFFAMDKYGNKEDVKTEIYTIDILPTGSITINDNTEGTNSVNVTLTLNCMDDRGCTRMQFSTDDVIYSSPESYTTKKSWALSSGNGTKTIYVKFEDTSGNWSQAISDSIILDTIPPQVSVGDLRFGASVGFCLYCDDGTGSGCDKIYYTTNGTTPTKNSILYKECTSAPKPLYLRYFGIDKAGNSSSVSAIDVR
jgi:YD repeat-containing protein